MEPVQQFLHTASAGGVVLALAAAVALVWANVHGSSYTELWTTDIDLSVGDWSAHTTLQKLAKDGLMAVFFFVVGLEIKRELTIGELADRRVARVPFFAALGGMVVPALIYAAFNAGGAGADGWGIAVGVLSLLSRRVPVTLGAFLLAIAVIDDIGAILVIAVFYSGGLAPLWLLGAGLCLAGVWLMLRWRVRLVVPYALLAIGAWAFMAGSGVSPTIAGVALGLLMPVRPWADPDATAHEAADVAADLGDGSVTHGEALAGWRRMDDLGRQAVPLAERLEVVMHPWSAFVVLPLFALAWAGIPLGGGALGDAAGSAVTLGVALGLVAGKLLGVTLGTWMAVRLGLGVLPAGVRWPHVAGVAALAGIGFTVSVFVSSLAFSDPGLVDEARVGIVGASLVAGLLGAAILLAAGRTDRRRAGA